MRRVIAWFVDNPVAANLLMLLMAFGGFSVFTTLHREEFPNLEFEAVNVRVVYPLATAEEVEESICVRLEEAIFGTEGIKQITASASQGLCSLTAELSSGADKSKVRSDIKNKVDGIDSFPKSAEPPVVTEQTMMAAGLQVVIHGHTDEHSLKRLGQRIKDDISILPEVSQVQLVYTRPYELSLEISEATLRRHGLTLSGVAETIRANSLNLPGGMVKTEGGQILLRTKAQAYWGQEYADIVVLAHADGTRVRLGDIAHIVDGFEDSDLKATFDGERAIVVDVRRIGKEDVLNIAREVKAYLKDARRWMPDGIEVTVWQDESLDLINRMSTLGKNAASGLLLVLVVLGLFLRLRLACWVALGIPIAVFGAVLMFPVFDLSISTMTVMGLILVLGVLVDDAVVVGERIDHYQKKGFSAKEAAVKGTQEVSMPVIFGVLTTIATFIPLVSITGGLSDFIAAIGYTAILALVFSLVESQLILPSHLSRHPVKKPGDSKSLVDRWDMVEKKMTDGLARFVEERYRPFIRRIIEWRYATLSVALSVLIITYGIIAGGHMVIQFFPAIAGERIYATVVMPEGTAAEETARAAIQLERAAEELRIEMDAMRGEGEKNSRIRHILVSVGTQVGKNSTSTVTASGSHFAEVALEIELPGDYVGPSTTEFAKRWRELAGAVPGAVEQTFTADFLDVGDPVSIELRGRDFERLRDAAAQVKQNLYNIAGVYDIFDSFRGGRHEVHLELLPEARTLGLSTRDLAQQVRQAFYGEEVQRIQRGKDEVRVYVRYPEGERRSLGNLEMMRIRTADGAEVPFSSVAKVSIERGMSTIQRVDGKRVVKVIADVDRGIAAPEQVLARLERDVFPQIKQRWPDISISVTGEAETQNEAMEGLIMAAGLSMFLVFALLSIPLKSYMQAFIIMSVIPFGAIGALLGHFMMGVDFVFLSSLGVVALAGVVVNSSLVLIDKANRLRREGLSVEEAIVDSACERFKPIMLTSTTTFVGLLPLMSSDTMATNMFVPMAVSLGGGVLFSTLISLVLIPALYRMQEDRPNLLGRAKMFITTKISRRGC